MDLDELFHAVKEIAIDKYEWTGLSDEELLLELEGILNRVLDGRYLSLQGKVQVIERLFSDFRGFGLLDQLMNDDQITELMVNGYDSIFIEKKGRIEKAGLVFDSEQALTNTIQKIVGVAGREVNHATPIVDTRLPDGSRVNVILPPISLVGPVMTVRKFSNCVMTLEHLIAIDSITQEVADFLRLLVEARYNIFVSGGTGSGKTTFLNVLSSCIPKDERVVTIEDSAELQMTKIDNLVRLETRNANSSGVGEVTIRDLIRASLRMRPDRIVVGEIRGREALDMLQAMNTGHDGALATGHANSAKDMLSRIETMVLQGEVALPLQAIRGQIASGLDIIVHLSRLRDRTRRVVEVSEVVRIEGGHVLLAPLFLFHESCMSDEQHVVGGLVRTNEPFVHHSKLKKIGKEALI